MPTDDKKHLEGQRTKQSLFTCGPRPTCPDGNKHVYDKWEKTPNGGTAVCSRCGHKAIDDAPWL